MTVKDSERNLFGNIRLGVVQVVDRDGFRCEVFFPDSIGGAKNVIVNPSPLIGFLPRPGTICAIYDTPGNAKRVLFPLSEISAKTDDEIAVKEDTSGTVPMMREDEIYIGRHGRAFFNAKGDVSVRSRKYRAGLDLKYEKSRAELYGYNFEVFTPGKGIRMRSASSVEGTVGDEFFIEKSAPVPPSPDNLPDPVTVPITEFKIDALGNSALRVGPSGAGSAWSMSVAGEIGIKNPLSELDLHMTGKVEMKNQTVSLTMDVDDSAVLKTGKSLLQLGADGGFLARGPSSGAFNYEFMSTPSGTLTLANPKLSFELGETGNATLSSTGGNINISTTGASLSMPSGGPIVVSSPGGVTVDGAALVKLQSALIQLGQTAAFHPALAEPVAAILDVLIAFSLLVQTHTHVIFGAVSGGIAGGSPVTGIGVESAQLAAWVPPPVPTYPTIASNTVTMQV